MCPLRDCLVYDAGNRELRMTSKYIILSAIAIGALSVSANAQMQTEKKGMTSPAVSPTKTETTTTDTTMDKKSDAMEDKKEMHSRHHGRHHHGRHHHHHRTHHKM